MPGGGQPLKMRYAVRSERARAAPIAEFITGWLKEIGIATTQKIYDDGQLTEVIGRGDYDMFVWGWTPFVDPDPMLSYFTCDQVASDPDDPTNYYNDANLCDPEYDKLYEQQKVELDPDKRMEIVHEMLTRFYSHAVYFPLYYCSPTCRPTARTSSRAGSASRRRPGPVLFSNTSPSYVTLKPASADGGRGRGGGGGDDGGGGAGLIIGLGRDRACSARWALMLGLMTPPHRRRARVSARFVITKVLGSLATLAFVVVFNFFLFRVVATDPVANLFRGRNLTQAQREELVREFGLDGSQLRAVLDYLQQTASLNFGRSYVTNEPVMSEIADKAPATIALVGVSTVLSAVFGILIGIVAGVAAAHEDRLRGDDGDDDAVLDARLLARDAAAVAVRRLARLVPDRRPARTRRRTRPGSRCSPTRRGTCSCRRSR